MRIEKVFVVENFLSTFCRRYVGRIRTLERLPGVVGQGREATQKKVQESAVIRERATADF